MLARACLSALVVLAAVAAAALPPVAPFPAALSPAGATLPANGRVLVFGSSPVSLADIGVAATREGALLSTTAAAIGCCTVAIAFDDPLTEGDQISLGVSGPGGDASATWTVGPADVSPPTVGLIEVVQVVSASRLTPPMTPREGPAHLLTLDLAAVFDDIEVAALASYDDDGALVTLEPPSGAPFERVRTGVVGAVDEACVHVEALDTSGAASTRQRVCAPVPRPTDDDEPGGCSAAAPSRSGVGWPALALAGVLLLRRRGRARRHAGVCALALLLVVGCAPPAERGSCEDGFDDHTFPASAFDDAFFDEHARGEGGWRGLKVLVVHLEEPAEREVRFYDNDFYALHDEWLIFRLMNGAPACGADELIPLDDLAFDTVEEIVAWARQQERLPPFLSWSDERLTAPDFYRLARDTTPRVYGPVFLTRGVAGEPRAYVLRVAGLDAIEAHELRAVFAALDPWMPAGRPLYWRPSPIRESHQALADALEAADDPLAKRIRRE